MDSEPMVSIIMNCFNGDQFLKEAMDSIYSQTFQNWEIIFWDNASTDSSAKIARSYDERVKYFRAEETTTLGKARVLATKEALGDFLAFLDCDDLWVENKLEKQIEVFAASSEDVGLVYGPTEIIFESNKNKNQIYRKGMELPTGKIFSKLTKENFIVFSSSMVDRKKFYECGGFPENFKNSTDYWIFLKIAQKYHFGVVEGICCKYRIHSNNLSASQNVIGVKEAIETVSSFLPDPDALKGLNYQYVLLANMYIKEKNFIGAINVILEHKVLWLFVKRLTDNINKNILD
jgi:glycosyltransferase involved in cell wall biosynthesis